MNSNVRSLYTVTITGIGVPLYSRVRSLNCDHELTEIDTELTERSTDMEEPASPRYLELETSLDP